MLLVGSAEDVQAAQAELASRIADFWIEMLYLGTGEYQDVKDAVGQLIKKVLDNVTLTALKYILELVVVLHDGNADATTQCIQDIGNFLSGVTQSSCNQLLVRCFTSGSGKQLLADAKMAVSQMTADRGCC